MAAALLVAASLGGALLVLAITQRLLRLALWLALAVFVALAGWALLRDHAPPRVTRAVEAAAREAKAAGGRAADRLAQEVEEVGARASEAATEAARDAAARATEAATEAARDAAAVAREEAQRLGGAADPPDQGAAAGSGERSTAPSTR